MKVFFVVCLLLLGACGSDSASDDCDPNAGAEVCEVFEIVNRERAALSLPALEWNVELAKAADGHAVDMDTQNYFDHDSLDGRTFSNRAKDAGYEDFPTGENIAKGQQTAAAVMQSWMTSPGHRRNILSVNSNEIGVGLRAGYWVQVFGKR